jgi:ribosomal protein S1
MLNVAKTKSQQSPLEALPVGYIIEAAKVTEVVEDQGVYVDIGVDGVKGFAHVYIHHEMSLTPDISSLRSAGRFHPSK